MCPPQKCGENDISFGLAVRAKDIVQKLTSPGHRGAAFQDCIETCAMAGSVRAQKASTASSRSREVVKGWR
jgi:hypothetical protein